MTLWLLGLITGIFVHAAWVDRQIRKDTAVLARLHLECPTLGSDLGWRPTVYVRLTRLQKWGLVCVVAQAQGRNVYHITEAGRCALVAECASDIQVKEIQ